MQLWKLEITLLTANFLGPDQHSQERKCDGDGNDDSDGIDEGDDGDGNDDDDVPEGEESKAISR